MARKCWALKMSKSSKSNCLGAENDDTDTPLDLGKTNLQASEELDISN